MLNFQPVRERTISMMELGSGLSRDDLRALTNEMVEAMQAMIADCVDSDVTHVPVDPGANDTFASNQAEVNIAWTLGHLIVHATASSEESAFLAAELARGVPNHGRSRAEVLWTTVLTIAECRERLEESRRMRLAMLDVWPAKPNLELTYEPYPGVKPFNAVARFLGGLSHDDSHLAQIADTVRQAKAARASR